MIYLEFLSNPDVLALLLLFFALYLVVGWIGSIPAGQGGLESLFGFPDFPFLEQGFYGIVKLAMVAIAAYLFWPLLFNQQLAIFLAIIAFLAWAVHRFFGFDYEWSTAAGLILLIAFTSNGYTI